MSLWKQLRSARIRNIAFEHFPCSRLLTCQTTIAIDTSEIKNKQYCNALVKKDVVKNCDKFRLKNTHFIGSLKRPVWKPIQYKRLQKEFCASKDVLKKIQYKIWSDNFGSGAS